MILKAWRPTTDLVDLLAHHDAVPRACRLYRAKTKGKVERPFRHIRTRAAASPTWRL